MKLENIILQHLHDTAANWDTKPDFIPEAAEIVVYDADNTTSYARLKIGDGKTTLKNLPFIDEELRTLLGQIHLSGTTVPTQLEEGQVYFRVV